MMNEVNYEIKIKNKDDNDFKNDFSKNEESETLTLKDFHFSEQKRYLFQHFYLFTCFFVIIFI